MTPSDVGDIFTHALFIILTLVVAIITPSLVVGLIVSTFQAATQINEQTLSFLPRLVITILTITFIGSWAVTMVTDYATNIYLNLIYLIG